MNWAIVLPVATLGSLVIAFASCATNDEANATTVDDAGSPTVDASEEADASEDASDGGCSASDPNCTTEILPCEKVSWCMVDSPVGRLHSLVSVWGSSKDDVWAVGSGGTVLHFDGKTWIKLPIESHVETFRVVWGTGPTDVWVAGTTSLVFRSTGFKDGKATWKNIGPSERSSFPGSSSRGRIVNTLWGSSKENVRIGSKAIQDSFYNDDFSFYYSGFTNQFVSQTEPDGEILWRLLPGRNVIVKSIWGSSADDVWMSADNSSFGREHERGLLLHGTPYKGGPPNPDIVTSGDAYCDGCEPGCKDCLALDDPLAWKLVDSQSDVPLEAIWGSSADDVWTVGHGGVIRNYRKGDVRWRKVDSPTKKKLRSVWGSGPNDVWAVGDSGTIVHYDGTRVTTSSVQLPLGKKPDLYGVWGSGPNDVWAVGDAVTLHFTGPKAGALEGSGGQ